MGKNNNSTKNDNRPALVTLLIFFALVLVAILGTFGVVSEFLTNFFLGAFGLSTYAFAICGCLITIGLLLDFKPNFFDKVNFSYVISLLTLIITLHIATSIRIFNSSTSFATYVFGCYTATNTVGGLLTGIIAYYPIKLLGGAFSIALFSIVTIALVSMGLFAKKNKKIYSKKKNSLVDFTKNSVNSDTIKVGSGLSIFNSKTSNSKKNREKHTNLNLLYPNNPDAIAEDRFDKDSSTSNYIEEEKKNREEIASKLFDFSDVYEAPDLFATKKDESIENHNIDLKPYFEEKDDTYTTQSTVKDIRDLDDSYSQYTTEYRLKQIKENLAKEKAVNSTKSVIDNKIDGETEKQERNYFNSFDSWINKDDNTDIAVTTNEDVTQEVTCEDLPEDTQPIVNDADIFDNSLEYDSTEVEDNILKTANEYAGMKDESDSTGNQFSVSNRAITQDYGFEKTTIEVKEEKEVEIAKVIRPYVAPTLDLLPYYQSNFIDNEEDYLENKRKLEESLKDFDIEVNVVKRTVAASFIRYEMIPAKGVALSRICNLESNLTMSLAAESIAIEAPIPGTNRVGIEVPRPQGQRDKIGFRKVLEESDFFSNNNRALAFGLGTDIFGRSQIADIERMPHMLVAGATNSGKSVCINCIICSLLYKYSPDYVRLILVDPKHVEFATYAGIPHLLTKDIINDATHAVNALNWLIDEMENRYKLFMAARCKTLPEYNEIIANDPSKKRMPYIVLIIDELADLMSVDKRRIEASINRLAAKARGAGILMILATQRPSVDVITGVIKGNLPSRIAFTVADFASSKTILDRSGAEKLLGYGDMLFNPSGAKNPIRIQGALLTTKDINAITDYVREHNDCDYDSAISGVIFKDDEDETEATSNEMLCADRPTTGAEGYDLDFLQCLRFCIECNKASISMLQTNLNIGYVKSARYISKMERAGFIGPETGNSKPREIKISLSEFIERFGDIKSGMGD